MRTHDWEARLFAAVEAARTTPFAWGAHDCALFVADVVLAMTGRDYAADLRGQYRTQSGALRLLAATPLRARMNALFASIDVRRAQRGDAVMDNTGALGVCLGEHAAFVGPRGVEMQPALGAELAWRVE